MTLADNIKTTRNIRNITQNELADALGVNQTFISQLENGKRVPTLEMTERIADVLDCSIDRLLERDTKYITR